MTVTLEVTVTSFYVLNGAGAESMQGKWDEMFGVKEEMEEEKQKKPAKKKTTKKATGEKKTSSKKPKTKKKAELQ